MFFYHFPYIYRFIYCRCNVGHVLQTISNKIAYFHSIGQWACNYFQWSNKSKYPHMSLPCPHAYSITVTYVIKPSCQSCSANPLIARLYLFLIICISILNMLKIKRDIRQQDFTKLLTSICQISS